MDISDIEKSLSKAAPGVFQQTEGRPKAEFLCIATILEILKKRHRVFELHELLQEHGFENEMYLARKKWSVRNPLSKDDDSTFHISITWPIKL